MNSSQYEVTKTDEQWREELSPAEYAILRQAATERPGTGELLYEDRVGIYSCRACGNKLFECRTKFEAHCGWPSFYESAGREAVGYIDDRSLGMVSTEVRCDQGGPHLGRH